MEATSNGDVVLANLLLREGHSEQVRPRVYFAVAAHDCHRHLFC